MKNFKNVTKRGLAMLLALVMIVGAMSLTAFAAEEGKTLPEELLEPADKDIIEPADKNGQDLIDGVYDALNPTENPDPDPDAIHSVGDIIEKDEEEKETVNGKVLDKADEAVTNAGETEKAVEDALTVGEDEEGNSITVDAAVKEQTDKANAALEAAQKAADAAAKAVEERDEKALEAAQKAADAAAKAAEDAYTNAQSIFDDVIGNLLTKDEQAEIIAKVEESLADKKVDEPGEDATAEEKAAYKAYQSEFQSALNQANLDAANDKIDAKYDKANEDILAAKKALETAQNALNSAKDAYGEAVKNANAAASGMTIEEYVKLFDSVEANEEKAQEVANAYGKVDSAKEAADKAAQAADDGSGLTLDKRIEVSQDTILDRNRTEGNDDAGKWNPNLAAAVNFIKDRNEIIAENLKKIQEAKPEDDTKPFWDAIEEAEQEIKGKTFYYYDDGSYAESQKFAWDEGGTNVVSAWPNAYAAVEARAKVSAVSDAGKAVVAAASQLLKDLDATKAAREQVKAEEELKKTLAGLSNLSYEDALAVVKGFETIKDCDALAGAGTALETQLKAAQDAAKKVEEANQAYEAAQKAVQDAMDRLNALIDPDLKVFDKGAFNQAKTELEKAKDDLEQAKKDKEEAEEEKKKADDAVIVVITGGDGDFDDFGGGDEVEIDDEAVPLAAGPVTRAEFVDYLWRHEGEPEAPAPTFADVPADHDFAPAIGWAQSIGLVAGNEKGEFEPDELVTVAAVRTILTRFAAYAGMTMPELTTLTGGDGEAVLNCDAVLAEFFGEDLAELAA